MDKLTAVRIKYDNGTYSNQIPVGVFAASVNWDTTLTLVDVLGPIAFSTKGSIQDQINRLLIDKIDYDQLNDYMNNNLGTHIAEWMDENRPPTTIDTSLSIEGAAADAAATGVQIAQIKESLNDVSINANDLGLYQDFSTGFVYPTYRGIMSQNGIPLSAGGGGGGDGVFIISTSIMYATSSSGTVAPTSGWKDTVPAAQPGNYLWTRTEVTYSDTTKTTAYSVSRFGADGTDGKNGSDGTDGVGIVSITNYYQVSTTNETAPEIPSVNWKTDPIEAQMDATNRYLWNYTIINYDNGTQQVTDPKVIGVHGQDGQNGAPGRNGNDGVGITSTSIKYAVNTNSTVTPQDSEWLDNMPNVSSGQFLWTKTTFNYSDATSKIFYTVSYQGANGADGTSVTVDSSYNEYQSSDSGTIIPSTWVSTIPTVSGGKYLWTRTTTVFSDGTFVYSYNVGYHGIDGTNGKNGTNGTSSFVHIKYSSVANPTDAQITETPSAYIGICIDTNASDPTTANSYTWSKWEGKDGENGTPGKNGANGTSSYVHFAYATSADGRTDFSLTPFPGAKYIGIRTDQTESDSEIYSEYTWSLFKGADGERGLPGSSSYVHIKYAAIANPTDSQMTEIPSEYIGIAIDQNISDPTTANSYTWSKWQGTDGENGTPGKNGKDGTSSYVHFAYATSAEGDDFSLTPFDNATFLGVLIDNIEADSNVPSAYTWSLIKGKDGANGTNGQNAQTYEIVLSSNVIKISDAGVISPASITCSFYHSDGSANREPYSGRYSRVGYDSAGNSVTSMTSISNASSFDFTPTSGVAYYQITLYKAGGTTTILDQQTIPVLTDPAAYTVYLDNENHTFTGTTTTATNQSVTVGVFAYRGKTQVATTIGTISGLPSEGMTATINDNNSISASITFTTTTALTTAGGVITIPVTVDGVSFTKQFSYSIAFKGATGDAGTPARIHMLMLSADTIKISDTGVISPSSIRMESWVKTGTSTAKTAYNARFQVVGYTSSGTSHVIQTSTANTSTTNFSTANAASYSYYVIILYDAGGTTNALDSQTIPVLTDKAAYTIYLDNENHTFAGTNSAAINQSVTVGVFVYKGRVQVAPNVGTIENLPTGMTATINSNNSTSASITFTVNTNMTSPSGSITIPITVDGITFNKTFSYSIAFAGADGTSVTILGSYNTIEELQTAHPTGSEGDAYMVGNDLYVWNGDEWTNVGQIKGADGQDGAPGENGKTYYVHFAYSTGPNGSGTFNVVPFDGAMYIGTLTDERSADSTTPSDYKWALFKGADGVSITSNEIRYQYSTSGTQAPEGTWSSTVPSVQSGKYLWTRTVTAYSDNTSSTSYSVSYIGTNGTSISISSTSVMYATSNSGTTKPSSGWNTSIPEVTLGDYLWTRTRVAYSDGTSTESYSVSRFGSDGENGTPGSSNYIHIAYKNDSRFDTQWFDGATYLGILTNENEEDSENQNDYKWSLIKGADGTGVTVSSNKVTYQYSNSGTERPTGTWSSTVPAVQNEKFLWTRTITTYSDNSSSTSYSVGYIGKNGSNGTSITISSTSVMYATSDNGTTAPSSGWGNNIPSVTLGNYLWTRTIVTYSDNSKTTAYSVTRFGTDGTNGTPGADSYIHIAYATSATGQQGFSTTWFNGATYVGIRTDHTESDSTRYQDYEWSLIKGADGAPGQDGVSVTSMVQHYAVSTTNSSDSSPETWVDDPSQVTMTTTNRYLWSYTTINYSNGNSVNTNPAVIGVYGDTGQNAKIYMLLLSVDAIKVAKSGTITPGTITANSYQKTGTSTTKTAYSGRFKVVGYKSDNTTQTVYTSSGNQSSCSFTPSSDYVSYVVTLYAAGGTTNPLDSQTIPVITDGSDGASASAYTVYLTNESHTFAGNSTSAIAGSTTTKVVAYKDTTQLPVTINSITGTIANQLEATKQNNGTTNAAIQITATNALTTRSGVLSINLTADGQNFIKQFSWSVALAGTDGRGIVSITPQYYLSTSGTEPVGGSWGTTQPTWQQGYYIWTRTKIVYTDSATPVYTSPYCDDSLNQVITYVDENDKDLQDQISDQAAVIVNSETRIAAIEKQNSSFEQTLDSIQSEVTTIGTDINGIQTTISTQIQQTSDEITLLKETTNENSKLREYITVDGSKMTFGSSDSDVTLELDNDKLAFKSGDTEVAYMSDQRMFITDATVDNELQISGKWALYIRSNDHLTLKWIG